MPTGVAICSLLWHAEGVEYDIYILASPGVTQTDRDLLQDQVSAFSSGSRISFVDMGERFGDGFEIRGISTACYYRLMIPWLLPHLDKVIYCDGDVIFHTQLSDLYAVDLEGIYVAGCVSSTREGWMKMRKYFDKLGLDYRRYVNSGVLVINCALQRCDGLDRQYEELSRRKFHYQDQDIINIVCRDHIGYFSCRFNLKPSEYGRVEGVGADVVIHYFGDKPWREFTFMWEEWWAAYKRSVFWNSEFYHDVSASILSAKRQLKTFLRKVSFKVSQYMARL